MNQSRKEKLFDHRLALIMQKQQAEVEAEIQRLMNSVELEAQANMLQMTQALQGGGQEQGGPGGEPGLPPGGAVDPAALGAGPGGDAGAQGGFANSPNDGGLPGDLAAPGQNTEESQSGLDRGGQPVQGIEAALGGQGEGIAG